MDDFDEIYSYSREQALIDGVLVDVTEMAKEAGIKYPTALTSTLWMQLIEPNTAEKEAGQDVQGRLWDTLTVFVYAVRALKDNTDTLTFPVLYLKEQPNGTLKLEKHRLKAVIGPGDDPSPVITIMFPHED